MIAKEFKIGKMQAANVLKNERTLREKFVNSTDIANYADDNTPYATATDIDSLITSLEEASKSLFTWFDNNLMKSNADKCHLLVSPNEKVTIKIGNHEM